MNTVTLSSPLDLPSNSPALPITTRIGHGVARAGKAIWRGLQEAGQARARREMLVFAAQSEATQPALAAQLRAAARHNSLG
ncbi:MAG: hypothetical protein ABIQ60_11315 [Burkholderiaceae bacterium]